VFFVFHIFLITSGFWLHWGEITMWGEHLVYAHLFSSLAQGGGHMPISIPVVLGVGTMKLEYLHCTDLLTKNSEAVDTEHVDHTTQTKCKAGNHHGTR
jgi:hypothetical protein